MNNAKGHTSTHLLGQPLFIRISYMIRRTIRERKWYGQQASGEWLQKWRMSRHKDHEVTSSEGNKS